MSTAVALPRHKLRVTDYHRMIEAGILTSDDRVELIEGDLIEMAPTGPEHADYIDYISETLRAQTTLKVRLQHPITLPEHSEPEPDIALVTPKRYWKAHPFPGDVQMIVEVADTSLEKDKVIKVPLYARFNIPEVWIVDVQGQVVECFWDPVIDSSEARYVQAKRVDQEQSFVTAKTLTGIKLDLNELWIKR